MNDNNNQKNTPNNPESGPQKIELPGGGYGVYMGETGKGQPSPRGKRRPHPSGAPTGNRPLVPPATSGNRPPRGTSYPQRYSLSDAERQEIERRHAAARAKRRAAADGRVKKYGANKMPEPTLKEGVVKYASYYLKQILDRIYMTWMGISIDLDTIIKSLIIAGMVLLFAILQTTVFARFTPFGATPDLMLALVIAVGTTEGERWGGATGLAAAFLIESLGGTGITLLPLLYVPVGYTVGVLCTEYLRDSVIIRTIYTFSAGILRAVITAIYANIAFDKVDAGLLFSSILIPEYFSTALMAFLPHVTEWFALKAFHRSREDRVS
ncbi:MAG: hypothetical protein E7660_03490 [Ruminococcaceae bacterium]|nr:hypothetical protein [Oscillospiraceae bacterium]